MTGVRLLARTRDFCVFQRGHTGSRAHQASYTVGTGVKWQGHSHHQPIHLPVVTKPLHRDPETVVQYEYCGNHKRDMARGSVVGSGTMLQAERSPDEVIGFFN
jgi:hypothetical protein